MNGRTNTTSVTEVIEGIQVPLEAPTNLVLTPLNARVDITWTDPVDKFAAPDGQTATNPWDNVATWSHTIIVRKANSAPTSPSDGELIYTETTRNQHQYTAYSDTNNVINNTIYYYAVYAITTMDAVSESIVDSCKPIEGMPTYKETLTSLRGNNNHYGISGVTINEQALFAGGETFRSPDYYPITAISRFDSSLTRHDDLSVGGAHCGAAAISSYGMFAGGYNRSQSDYHARTDVVRPINNSFTYVSTSESLSEEIQAPLGLGFNNHIIFAGGNAYRMDTNNVDSFDSSITKQSLDKLYAGVSTHGGTVTSQYAFYGGGGSSYCKTYNNSLTSMNATNLSVSSTYVTAGAINDRAIFFNGYINDNNGNPSDIIDIYDNSLTKTSVSAIPRPTYPDDGYTYEYYPGAAYHFGSFLILVLIYSSAGPCYSAAYLFDDSITLQGDLFIPNQETETNIHAEIGNKYSLAIAGSKGINVYESI